jgi:hypothetical protein
MKPLVFVIAAGLAAGTEAQTGPQSSPRRSILPPRAEKAKAKDVPKRPRPRRTRWPRTQQQMVNPDYLVDVPAARAANP